MSRSIADSVRKTAAISSQYKQSIALTKDNEEKVEAIENELIKLGSEVGMCVGFQHCLINCLCV